MNILNDSQLFLMFSARAQHTTLLNFEVPTGLLQCWAATHYCVVLHSSTVKTSKVKTFKKPEDTSSILLQTAGPGRPFQDIP